MSAAFLVIALLASVTSVAKPIEERDVISGKVKLDPAKGYIFLTGQNREIGMFVRMPDDADIATYREDSEKAFAKTQKKYPAQLASWQSSVALAQTNRTEPPEKPVVPSRDSFTIGAIQLRTKESFGPTFVYAKNDAASSYSYLTSLKPGTYVWYGPIMLVPRTGYQGVCYCMGSVKFEVRPGVVTDLGNFLTAAPQFEAQSDVPPPNMDYVGPAGVGLGVLAARKISLPTHSAEVRFGLPASLQGWPHAQAEFSASGKLDNFLGITISRLPPIPGVLAYRRDTVIDVKSNTELPMKSPAYWP
jgi:hypothetical protein